MKSIATKETVYNPAFVHTKVMGAQEVCVLELGEERSVGVGL